MHRVRADSKKSWKARAEQSIHTKQNVNKSGASSCLLPPAAKNYEVMRARARMLAQGGAASVHTVAQGGDAAGSCLQTDTLPMQHQYC